MAKIMNNDCNERGIDKGNGVEISKHGNAWVNCLGCGRRQTAALTSFAFQTIHMPEGRTTGTGMDRSTLCPTCSEGMAKAYPACAVKSDLNNPVIAVDRARKQIAIFNDFTCVREYEFYTNEVESVEAAKAWVKARTTVEPIMQYPRITFRS